MGKPLMYYLDIYKWCMVMAIAQTLDAMISLFKAQ